MSILLALVILFISFIASGYFVVRDAKKLATHPPTPLVDLDRMFDVIFERMDKETGQTLTPGELSTLLNGFVVSLGKRNLISEDITQEAANRSEATLEYDTILDEIRKANPEIDVPDQTILQIIDMAFTYLSEVNAVT